MDARGWSSGSYSIVWIVRAAGVLLAGAPLSAQCTTHTECADADFCTIDTCFNPGPAGECIHTPETCADGLYCNGIEQCDEARDACEFACLGGTVCEDGFCVCNEPGKCPGGNPGAACDVLLQPVSCSQGEVCNEELNSCAECSQNIHCAAAPEPRCNTATGECVQCFLTAHCVDTLFCNGQETCNVASGLCETGAPVNCEFPQFCSDLLDRCVECENNAHCDDGLYCNGGEACVDDMCEPGTPVDCAAMNPATPLCNEFDDNCVACLTDAHCDDDKFCTSDSCNTLTHECNNEPDSILFCDDGVFCNGDEECNTDNTGCVAGTPPACGKTCFQGTNPGAACTSDAECGKACQQGNREGLDCEVDADCNKACAGGSDDGAFCVEDDECESRNCTSRGLCARGICRGGCSEMFEACVQCAPDVTGSSSCNDGLFCDGLEICTVSHQCASPGRQLCEAFNDACTKGLCNEVNGSCAAVNRPDDVHCDDGNPCTRLDACQDGICLENPPESDDPYRCIRIQLVPEAPGNLGVGSTARVRLMAYADRCNVPSSYCPSNSPPISGLEAYLSWDPAKLELQTSVLGDLNPEDPCNSSFSCFQCPAGQYDWANSNPWPSDCTSASNPVNGPCICLGGGNDGVACLDHEFCDTNPSPGLQSICGYPGTTPGNDGDVGYLTTMQTATCNGSLAPPCVPPTGLHVTTFKFKALPAALGSSATVEFMPCDHDRPRRVNAVSLVPAPAGYTSQDVTKSIASTVNYTIVSCTSSTACDDNNPCTNDLCLNGNCQNTPRDCGDPDPCTVDSCDQSNGACLHTPINCGAGNRCFSGECFETCLVTEDCDDEIDCTIDQCDAIAGEDICRYTPDDGRCETGLFCTAQRCDPQSGCIADHECFSTDGNPCPDNLTCQEDTDTCGGCLAPITAPLGPRYLSVVPADQGGVPVAFLVEGDCGDSGVACISKYVQSNCNGGPNDGQACVSDSDCPRTCVGGPTPGLPCAESFPDCGSGGTCAGICERGRLGDNPVFLTAQQWGAFYATGLLIRPGSDYRVMADCDFAEGRVLSAAAGARTRRWGDASGDGRIDVLDISTVVNGIKELWAQATFEGANVWPCDVDGAVNVLDLSVTVDALKNNGIFPCASNCPS